MTDLEILTSAGFITSHEGMSLQISIENMTLQIEVMDADTLISPSSETTDYIALMPYREANGTKKFAIAIQSVDVRDIVAFSIAASNHVRFGVLGHPVDPNQQFEFHGTSIHNPFGQEQYGDWVGEIRAAWPTNDYHEATVVVSPFDREWAAEYSSWRDEYFANVYPTAVPGSPVPGV